MEIVELKYTVRATLPSPDGDGKAFNYEVIEITGKPAADETPNEAYGKLKQFVHQHISWKEGNPLQGGAVIPKPAGFVKPAVKAAPRAYATPDWSKMYCKFNLPFKTNEFDARQVGQTLKSLGCKFRGKKFYPEDAGADNCWYAPTPIEGTEFLEKYCTVLAKEQASKDTEDNVPW